MLNIIMQMISKYCSMSKESVYDYAIGIEHSFYEEFNEVERKNMSFLDLKKYIKWHIEQCERCKNGL